MRTFDFSVEPGKAYRYRARLVVLAQPRSRSGLGANGMGMMRGNHGSRRAAPIRRFEHFGAWSEPSPPVTVP
jgi:hypothetical protein